MEHPGYGLLSVIIVQNSGVKKKGKVSSNICFKTLSGFTCHVSHQLFLIGSCNVIGEN